MASPSPSGRERIFPCCRRARSGHHLLLTAEYAHFSRSFITEPEPLPGVQLDVGSVRGTWRLFPLSRRGLHFEAGIGISLLRDRLRMALPGRRVTSSQTLVGLPVEVGLGWTIGRQVDLNLRYSHTVPVTGDTSSVLGQLGLGVGVRL